MLQFGLTDVYRWQRMRTKAAKRPLLSSAVWIHGGCRVMASPFVPFDVFLLLFDRIFMLFGFLWISVCSPIVLGLASFWFHIAFSPNMVPQTWAFKR